MSFGGGFVSFGSGSFFGFGSGGIVVGGGVKVYGMYFDPGMGYKNNKTKGVATADG